MAELTLNYGAITSAYRAANKAADFCGDYADEISRKVTKKLSDLERGSSSKTADASYFAKRKIDELNRKATVYSGYASRLDDFLNGPDGAKAVDESVSKYIKTSSEIFRKAHNMEVSGIAEWFTWLTTTILNSTAFGRWLKQAFEDVGNWLSDAWHDIKYWYTCDGGEYVIKIIAGAILLIAAIVVLVVAWPALIAAITALSAGFSLVALWGVISTGAALITAIIGVLDGITNTFFNTQALITNSSDPAWAQRYDSYNSTSEFLEKHRFDTKEWNKFSYGAATVIDITSKVCAIINIVDLAKNGVNFFKNLKNFKNEGLFKKITFKNDAGKITWKSFGQGMKSISANYKAIKGKFTTNQWKDIGLKNSKLAYYADKVSNTKVFKSVESAAKFINKLQDKGFGKAVLKYAIDKTIFTKQFNKIFKFA